MSNEIIDLKGNYLINGDWKDYTQWIRDKVGALPLIIADPPYGNILKESWDKVSQADTVFAQKMTDDANKMAEELMDLGSVLYHWGGIGKYGFRPFFKFITMVEEKGILRMADLITWKKKRAYGHQSKYLFVREECAYFTKGPMPRTFHVPYLQEKRICPSFNEKYQSKSEYYRRPNVWTDIEYEHSTDVWDAISEKFSGKIHPAEKPTKLARVMIETHTEPEEYVLDPFAGSGSTAEAAAECGRKFIMVEKDPSIFETMLTRIRKLVPKL